MQVVFSSWNHTTNTNRWDFWGVERTLIPEKWFKNASRYLETFCSVGKCFYAYANTLQTLFCDKKCTFCEKENGSNDPDTTLLLAVIAYFNVECMLASIYEVDFVEIDFSCVENDVFVLEQNSIALKMLFCCLLAVEAILKDNLFPIQYRRSWTIDSAIVCLLWIHRCCKIDRPRWNQCVSMRFFSKLSFENASQCKKVFAMLRKHKLGELRKIRFVEI